MRFNVLFCLVNKLDLLRLNVCESKFDHKKGVQV